MSQSASENNGRVACTPRPELTGTGASTNTSTNTSSQSLTCAVASVSTVTGTSKYAHLLDGIAASIARRDFTAAIQTYFTILLEDPTICSVDSDSFAEDLIYCLTCFCDSLPLSTMRSRQLWIWNKALELSKESSRLVNNAASVYLVHCGELTQALQLLKRTLKLKGSLCESEPTVRDEVDLRTITNIESIKCRAIDRWHFRMLNDDIRNDCYYRAIKQAVSTRPNCSVLDIGSGTGILAMYAAICGAGNIYCCEVSPVLAHISSKVVACGKYAISIINKSSFDVQIGVDIPERVDLVVTELVDSGLLGEHIIPVLADARHRLLASDGIVIPHSAEVNGYFIECDEIKQRSYHDGARCTAVAADERYTCERINRLPHKALTHPLRLGSVMLDGSITRMDGLQTMTTALISGRCDAFVYWFDLFLLPVPETDNKVDIYSQYYHFTTSPSRDRCGWDQALLLGTRFGQFPQCWGCEKIVEADSALTVHWCYDNDDLMVDIQQATPYTSTLTDPPIYHAGEMDVAMKNNDHRRQQHCVELCEQLQSLFQHSQDRKSESTAAKMGLLDKLHIVEIGARWDSIAINAIGAMATTTAGHVLNSIHSDVFCEPSTMGYLEAAVKSCPGNASISIQARTLSDILLSSTCDLQTLRTFVMADVVAIPELVEGCGHINQACLKEAALMLLLRDEIDSAAPFVVFVPHCFSAHLALISCSSLRHEFVLDPINLCHLKTDDASSIANLVNEFGSQCLSEVDVKNIPDLRYLTSNLCIRLVCASPLSASYASRFHWFARYLSASECVFTSTTVDACHLKSPKAFACDVCCVEDGELTGVVVWFSMAMVGDRSASMTTGPSSSTDSHWRQTVYLVDSACLRTVTTGDVVSLRITLDTSYGLHCELV